MLVTINIKTTIFHEDGNEVIEASSRGCFYQKKSASFLQYEEEGEAGLTRTTIKIAKDEALILRSGAIKMRLPFVLNQEMKGSYELPFGKFPIASFAKRIEHAYFAESGKGRIDIRYDFTMQETAAAHTYHLEITFQEEKK